MPVETPMGWRELVGERLSQRAPEGFTDPPVELSGHLREQARAGADEAIAAWRERIWPRHGVRG